MNFVDLKKTIAEKEANAYYIFGEDAYLRNNALNIILTHFNVQNKELNENVFFSENVVANKVLDACNTLPFFSERKIVIIKENGGKLEENFNKRLLQYLKNSVESTVLIICASEQNELFKPIEKECETVECSKLDFNLLSKWLEAELLKNEKQMDFETKKFFIECCNFNLQKISIELQKVIAFSGAENVITKSTVEMLVVKDLEFQVFELTNAMGDKNEKKTLILAKSLIDNNDAIHSVLGLIFNYFRRMLHSILSNKTNAEIAKELNIKEYAVKMSKQTATKFGAVKLKKINELCVETDHKIKSGMLDLENGLYILIYNILKI